MKTTVPQAPTEYETGDHANHHTATSLLRETSRDALLAALDGIQLDTGEQYLVKLLARLAPVTVGAAVQLIERCRAGAGRYTTQLRLSAAAIEEAYVNGPDQPGWQVLDASDESTWYDITNALECEDEDCIINDLPNVECVVVQSTAWNAGFKHLESDELFTVRIPAGDL